HAGGRITYANGTPNRVMGGERRLRPDPESDAVTALKLSPKHTLDVRGVSRAGARVRFNACSRFAGFPVSSGALSVIALTADGPVHLSGEIVRSGRCYTALLAQQRSMSIPASNAPAYLATALVPIEREYT